MNKPLSHRRTWAAILTTVVLVVPGLVGGALVAAMYRWFLGNLLGGSWLTATAVIHNIAMLWFPSLLHGIVAGAIAAAGTQRLFAAANLEIVSYSASAVWIAVGVIVGGLNLTVVGFQPDMVSLVAQVVGIVAGLFGLRGEGT